MADANPSSVDEHHPTDHPSQPQEQEEQQQQQQQEQAQGKPRFAPKTAVQLNPPKDDPMTAEELALCNGSNPEKPTYLAIKGIVYDVSGNKAYMPGGSYNVMAGKDASRALAKTSLKAEDCKPEWRDLDEKEQGTLNDWEMFFRQRYNVVGKVVG